jgi:hypothetical protein
MTVSMLTGCFSVDSEVPLQLAVSRALFHFGCGVRTQEEFPSQYAGVVLPSFTLNYRGCEIPVSSEDTAGTLTTRVQFYLNRSGCAIERCLT